VHWISKAHPLQICNQSSSSSSSSSSNKQTMFACFLCPPPVVPLIQLQAYGIETSSTLHDTKAQAACEDWDSANKKQHVSKAAAVVQKLSHHYEILTTAEAQQGKIQFSHSCLAQKQLCQQLHQAQSIHNTEPAVPHATKHEQQQQQHCMQPWRTTPH